MTFRAPPCRNEKKTNDKRGIYFNYTNSVKLTVHYETNFSIRNVLHTSIKNIKKRRRRR